MAAALLLVAVLSCCAALGSAAATPLPFEYDCSFLGDQHNFSFGALSSGDKLFCSQTLSLDHPELKSLEFRCPDKSSQSQGTISYIEVTDLRTDGSGGCAYVSEGGVGFQGVSLHLQSLKGTGFDFHVEVWGR